MEYVTLISSGQPSANPRLVKEATALDNAGYTVTVIYLSISPWADEFDKKLFQQYPRIRFIRAGYHPEEQKLFYKWVRARRKLYLKLWSLFGNIFNTADYSLILLGQELLKKAKQHKADLYIAHNLGALPVAVKVAKKYNAKVGFDAEDFHRGEISQGSQAYTLVKSVENKYFPLLNYFSAASPLILDNYQRLYPNLKGILLNNTFEKKFAAYKLKAWKASEPLKLFWFSQKVGEGRGIESAIKAVCEELKSEEVTLTLLGNCSQRIREYLESLVTADVFNQKIEIKAPVDSEQIFKEACDFHIGLALEPGRDINNNIALSNKLFTYLLAGNAIIATSTSAQADFMIKYSNIGFLSQKDDFHDLACAIRKYLGEPDLLQQHRENALKLAKTNLNWDTESKSFLTTVSAVLSA